MVSVGLFPDRFAHYRYPLFKLLSGSKDYALTIYADTRQDNSVKLAPATYADLDIENGGVRWGRVRNVAYKGICFWQKGVIAKALFSDHDIMVYWGEMQRISTWLATWIGKLRGKKVVYWSHGVYGNEGEFKMWLRLKFLRQADYILLYGNYAKKLLLAHSFDERHLGVIYNSLDYERHLEIMQGISETACLRKREEWLTRQADFLAVFVGRLTYTKRLDMLLEAVSKIIREEKITLTILLIGDGVARESLAALAESLGIAHLVHFYGACYQDEELLPLLAAADFCVSPGNVGLSAIHALMAGTPVITHDKAEEQGPEFEVIEEGINGAYFQVGDIEDMAQKIVFVVEQIKKKAITIQSCQARIHQHYNPKYQSAIFEKMIADLSV